MTIPDPMLILSLCAAIVAICMTLSGALLIGFARHRLRVWNIYFALSVAFLAAVRYGEYATGHVNPTIVLICWVNLAIGSVIGLIGVLRLAKTDPPVFRFRR